MALPGGIQELFPGIPDDITLNHITTKLPWSAFQILTSVSCGWRHAIRSRKVHDARVRSNSTETLLLVSFHCQSSAKYRIALYSKRDNRSYDLPLFPYLDGCVPVACKCIALDGKIYVLGGLPEYYDDQEPHTDFAGSEVYVLDLFGQRGWEKCSNMLAPRAFFGCAAINGKIYVIGGSYLSEDGCESEAYDPTENTWSPIKPMTSLRFDQYVVVAMGDEIIVHGGISADHYYLNGEKKRRRDGDVVRRLGLYANFVDIYDPVKDDWRVVDPFGREKELLFLAHGKLHSVSTLGIHVYGYDKKSWTSVHSFSLAAMGPIGTTVLGPSVIQFVDNELLGLFEWVNQDGNGYGYCLLLSEGFGFEEIAWKKITRNKSC